MTGSLKSLGYIYITPVFSEILEGEFKYIKIPIQNNLILSVDSIKAEYNKIDFMNRIGSVSQYTRTESRTCEVETNYFVETTSFENGYYNIGILQRIESMYKSLVYPQEIIDKNNESVYYSRPPLVNISFGTSSTSNAFSKNNVIFDESIDSKKIINNFFTFSKTSYTGNIKKENKLMYRSFVATEVSIEKDAEKIPFHIEGSNAYDYAGFKVRLSLLEVDPNYLGISPSFNDYYNFGMRNKIN
jgi:hypothetical protein